MRRSYLYHTMAMDSTQSRLKRRRNARSDPSARASLLFGYNQSLEDPRDGLTLLGQYDPAQNYGVKYGVVATKEAIGFLVRF